MNNYTIYMHKNKINKKVYIGQTCQKPEYRWNNGKGYSQCPAFYNAIQKYGWDNFEHIILYQNLTKEEANTKEQELIKKYKTTEREFGYNCQIGGSNNIFTEEGQKKITQALHKRWESEEYREYFSNLMKEKWKTEEYQKRRSEGLEKARKKCFEETGSRSFITKEGRKKISEARQKYMNEHKDKYSHKLKCINTGQEFSSYTEAAKWAGLKDGSSFTKYFSEYSTAKSVGTHPVTHEKLQWERI